MPETVAHRREKIEPLPAEMLWRASETRSVTRWRDSCRLFHVSEMISERKERGIEGMFVGVGKVVWEGGDRCWHGR